MATNPDPLALPEDAREQGGWDLVEQSTETLFEVATARIRGTTCRYDDQRTRSAVHDATDGGIDHPIRFFATTNLGFTPPLPPGTGPAMVMPMLVPEARRNFKNRLQERGLADVSREGTERVRNGDRTWVRLTRYSACDPGVGDAELPLECWLGVWNDGGIAMATSAYPTISLAEQLDLETDESVLTKDGQAYREEFRSLLRSL